MKTVRMVLESGPGHQWTVSDDDGNTELFSCPIQALLRAKHRFHRIPKTELAVLWVSLDGASGTPLLIRENHVAPAPSPLRRMFAFGNAA